VGPDLAEVWSAGDPVRDSFERALLLDAVRQTRFKEDGKNPNRMILYLGARGEPFPAPLVRTVSGWRFDNRTGAKELTNRRIRRNELAAIGLCRQYVDAQLDYATRDNHGRTGFFALRIRSSPGQRDGLYWPLDGAQDESPMGPMFGQAAFAEPQPDGAPRPLFGYYFKILVQQGADAAGGVMDYRLDGKLVTGFALIAWPAEYGVSGGKSFLVNQSGEVYEKDLGAATSDTAAQMTVFDPDPTWARAHLDGDNR